MRLCTNWTIRPNFQYFTTWEWDSTITNLFSPEVICCCHITQELSLTVNTTFNMATPLLNPTVRCRNAKFCVNWLKRMFHPLHCLPLCSVCLCALDKTDTLTFSWHWQRGKRGDSSVTWLYIFIESWSCTAIGWVLHTDVQRLTPSQAEGSFSADTHTTLLFLVRCDDQEGLFFYTLFFFRKNLHNMPLISTET